METPAKLGKPTNAGAKAQPINTQPYICRFINGEVTTSANNNRQIVARLEILTPDKVPSALNPDLQVTAAGGTTQSYFIIDPAKEDKYAETYGAFERLQLISQDGSLEPSKIVEAMNTGGVCFEIVLGAEEDIVRYPKKQGQKVGEPMKDTNGKEISKGWRIKTAFASDYIGRRLTLNGLPEVPPL